MIYKWLVLFLWLGFAAIGSAQAQTTPLVDNALWAQVLDQYVDDRGYVDYQGLYDNRTGFDQYLAAVETNGPKTSPRIFPSEAAQLAYYINAYNALVFKGVLDRGPEKKSVWRGLISGLNFFVRMDITVDGNETSLKALEDDIVRARFGDPRIHAALNCASIGCPRLIREPYDTDKLEQQLQDAMVEFLNGVQHIKIDPTKNLVQISKIFDWFEEDFIEYERLAGNSDGSKDKRLIDYINRFRSADAKIPNDYKVRFLEYDKRINSTLAAG